MKKCVDFNDFYKCKAENLHVKLINQLTFAEWNLVFLLFPHFIVRRHHSGSYQAGGIL